MKLYEITDLIRQLDNVLECETIDERTHHDTMELVQFELEEKSSNLFYFIQSLQGNIDFISSEIKRLSSLKSSQENKLERLKYYILENLKRANIKKIEFPNGTFSLRKSQSVNLENPKDIPAKYKTIEYLEKIDKNMLKSDFKLGFNIPGASLVTKENLIIK